MARDISAGLLAHIAQPTTTLAVCWKLTLLNSTVLGFTNHVRDLSIDGVTYHAETGIMPTALATESGTGVDNMDITAIIDSEVIKDEDLLRGLYDYADIEIFLVNYEDLTQGKLTMMKGKIGDVNIKGDQFVAEARSLLQAASQATTITISETCRVKNLGDAECKLNLTGYTFEYAVSAVTSPKQFEVVASIEENGYFDWGTVEFLTGLNTGLITEVKSFTDKVITLQRGTPFAISVGDIVRVISGCDRRFTTCAVKFDNQINFRGEPFVPGLDFLVSNGENEE